MLTTPYIVKTLIVVNDSCGFLIRVIGTFVNEALAMLGEGVEPASIEQAGSQAGIRRRCSCPTSLQRS